MIKIFEYPLKICQRIFDKLLITFSFIIIILFGLYMPALLDFFGNDKSLNIYLFTEFVSPDAVREFENETGVKVYLQYFESNEELYAKLKINEGKGYDIITPSDYMVERLHKEGLLQKLDYKKIPNNGDIDQRLLHMFFDPNNEYSIPISWNVYGLVYEKSLMKDPEKLAGFDLIFKDPDELVKHGCVTKPYKICMLDDSREVFMLGLLFLTGSVYGFNEAYLKTLQAIFIRQKKWVECYTNFGLRYFLEGNIAACAVTSNRYAKTLLEDNDRFTFCVPEQGAMLVIENFALPVHSKKTELAHKFINFMLSRKNSTKHFNTYGGNPANQKSYQDIDRKYFEKFHFFPNDEIFTRLHLTHNDLPVRRLEDLWLGVKFA